MMDIIFRIKSLHFMLYGNKIKRALPTIDAFQLERCIHYYAPVSVYITPHNTLNAK